MNVFSPQPTIPIVHLIDVFIFISKPERKSLWLNCFQPMTPRFTPTEYDTVFSLAKWSSYHTYVPWFQSRWQLFFDGWYFLSCWLDCSTHIFSQTLFMFWDTLFWIKFKLKSIGFFKNKIIAKKLNVLWKRLIMFEKVGSPPADCLWI